MENAPMNTQAMLVRQSTMLSPKMRRNSTKNLFGTPGAYGYPQLQNDPRAHVPSLESLFDVIDLNESNTVTLDEMQWFLELQGTQIKRTEFQQVSEQNVASQLCGRRDTRNTNIINSSTDC